MLVRKFCCTVFSFATLLVAACSSSSDAPASAGADQKATTKNPTDPAKKGGGDAPLVTPAPAAGPAAPSAATCGKSANHEVCETCCLGKDDVNLKVKTAAMDKCMCDQAKSKCTAECAKGECPGPDGALEPTSIECADSCQVDMGSCADAADKACAADPTCAAADKCYTEAKCENLPDGPDETTVSSSSSSDSDSASESSGDDGK